MGSCLGKQSRTKDNLITVPKRSNIMEYNALLDRLGSAQLQLLKVKFKEAQTGNRLDLKGFKKLLPLLRELPNEIIINSFKVFDLDASGFISWHNFCVTVSQYIVGHREEKCKFLFKIFDLSSSNSLAEFELKLMEEYCANYIRNKNILLGSDKETIMRVCVKEKKALSFEIFKAWALDNLELHLVLQPFEIIPSPVSEKEIIRNIISEAHKHGLRLADEWNVISALWFDAWKRYVNYSNEDCKEPYLEQVATLAKNRSRSVIQGARPIEIDNNDIVDPNCELKLYDDLTIGVHYDLIPNSA